MSRNQAVVLSACLAWALVAVQADGGFPRKGGRTERATSEHDSTVLTQDAVVAAFVDDAPSPALAERLSDETCVSPRLLGHRFVPPSTSSDWETRLHGVWRDRRVPNWVSSYLPESEFCTVLSRFRI